MTEITVQLSAKSIDSAIKQLRAYKKSLAKKLKLLQKRVVEELRSDVETGFNGSLGEDIIHEGQKVPNVEVSVLQDGKVDFVIAKGKEAVFVEFGAGVFYNAGGGRPDRPEGIVAIGEYGYGYGKRKVWGFYDENGELKLTHGTPSSMPMFYAAERVAKLVPQLAKEIFREE